MASLRESFFNNKGMGVNPLVEGLTEAPAPAPQAQSPVQEDFGDAVVTGMGATAGVVASVGLIALGIWAWNHGKEVANNVGNAIGSGLDAMAKNAKIAKHNNKMQDMLKRFDGDAKFQQLVSALRATPYNAGNKAANKDRAPNIKALKDYIESMLSPEEKGYLTALYDAAK